MGTPAVAASSCRCGSSSGGQFGLLRSSVVTLVRRASVTPSPLHPISSIAFNSRNASYCREKRHAHPTHSSIVCLLRSRVTSRHNHRYSPVSINDLCGLYVGNLLADNTQENTIFPLFFQLPHPVIVTTGGSHDHHKPDTKVFDVSTEV